MSDYELVYMAQEHIDEARDALYKKYKKYLDTVVTNFYQKYDFNRFDIDDIKLECLLVFENVIDKYNQDKNSKFSSYLHTCLTSKLTDILRTISSKKSVLFNKAKSLEDEEAGIKLIDTLYNNKDLVENNLIDDKTIIDDFITSASTKLSTNELAILKLLIKGYSQDKIAKILDINIKQVYNAIYRLKNKLKKDIL